MKIAGGLLEGVELFLQYARIVCLVWDKTGEKSSSSCNVDGKLFVPCFVLHSW